MTDDDAPNMTVTDAADWFGVKPQTVRRWVDTGVLEATVTPSGRVRFTRRQLLHAATGKVNS